MKKGVQRFWIVTAICGATALLFLLLVWGGPRHLEYDPLQRLEFFTEDLRSDYGTKTPRDPRIVLVGIDRNEYASSFSDAELKQDPVLKLLGQAFPWPRAVWADLIAKLADAGAKVIVLDLAFGGEKEGDEALRSALDKYKDHVVIACNIHYVDTDRGENLALDVPNPSVLNSSSAISTGLDERVGYDNVWADWDGVLRSARYRLEGAQSDGLVPNGTVLESLAARALRKFGHPELIPRGSDPIRFRYTGRRDAGYQIISLSDVLGPRTWKNNFKNGAFFRDKIVVVGPTADIFQDTHRTPFTGDLSPMHGPEVHCNMIGAALHGSFLRNSPLWANLWIVAFAGLLATVLSFQVHQPLRRLAAILVLAAVYWFWAQWLFNHADLVIPVASPLLVLTISGVFVLTYDYFVQLFERTRVRRTLERYVSKNIVKEVLDNPETYFNSLGGVRKRVTILFSDLRGFTTLAESADSSQLVKQLNEYFEEMTRHVFQFEGTLDKFIGDAVMAVWGNIESRGPEIDAQHAVSTALAMIQSLAKLNLDWKKRGMLELHLGIGINHGEVIAGNLGSESKMDATVIGDAVNLASRLEGLTKYFHVELLIGETVAPLVREKFLLRTVGLIQPKGKTKPIEVFTVLGEKGAINPAAMDWFAEYEEAVKLYRRRAFEEALKHFELCRGKHPDDYLASRYCAECEALLKHPADEHWNGVFVMSEK